MHPILLRIPLPHTPLRLWWVFAAAAAIAAGYAVAGSIRRDRNALTSALVAAAVAAIAAWRTHAVAYEAPNLPIYAYGVMLGASLVVGWYLTLSLAANDGLPKETMANCYVVTALAALAGSRVLYIVTNLDDFHSVWDFIALRKARVSGCSRGPTTPSRASRRGCSSPASAVISLGATSESGCPTVPRIG
jgi:phosphatidylglycerol---prolipoprotein diacylglyceryl transferase